jgi:transcriptional regulator with XRE-family HTH domain
MNSRTNRGRTALGSLISGLRKRNGWTLKEMSARCGIPLSTLAKVEHDRLSLTYDKLVQLSQRLNIRMSELFSDHGVSETPVTARRSIGHIDDAVRVTTANYDYYYLCCELRRKRMVPILVRVRAKSLEEFGPLLRHAGEEYVYVLEGAIEVHTEFYDPVMLGKGESIYIDSTMGHAYLAAADCSEALAVAVCASGEDGLLDSLLTLHDGDADVRPSVGSASPMSKAARAAGPIQAAVVGVCTSSSSKRRGRARMNHPRRS